MKLIDKDALVAEIEKRISRNKKRKEWEDIPEKRHQLIIEGQLLGELKHFLDSLEVKEVDSTDAFIEKALAFIRSCTTYDGLGYKARCVNIDEFRKYMEGE
jgi:hypothetical protein